MEYGGLIVNLGLRVEFANRDMEQITDYFHPFRRDTVEAGIVYDADANGVVTPRLDANGNQIPRMLLRNNFERSGAVATDMFINPSLGVSHPIGTNAAMYFSYARNQQLLPFTTLYQFYDGNSSNNPFFTYQNPEQAPITSNNYELGVQWEFQPGWGLDVNTYMRSIDNYSQATLQATNRNPTGEAALVGAFHNFATSAGYADSRGIEMVIRRAPLELANDVKLALTGSYTFGTIEASSVAGTNVTTFRDLNPNTPESATTLPFENTQDFRNFPQAVRGGASTLTGGYGRTHRFVLRSVAELPFDVSVGLSGNLESGFLYPKVIDADPRDRELLTGPSNYNIDLRLEKRFSFAERFGLDVYMDVLNLTNAQNIVAYESFTPSGPAVFQETGSPGARLINQDGTSIYGPARAIFFGTRARF
jgi:outer membrane receptor protein involved in Fe transport